MAEEPVVNMTIKELVMLHGAQLAAKLDTVEGKVDNLATKVSALETKVEGVAARVEVKDALEEHDQKLLDRASDRKWTSNLSRKDRIVAGIGVSAAVVLGIINTIALAVGGGGHP